MRPTSLLAIDPGNCAGWALFYEGKLRNAGVTNVDTAPCDAVNILLTPHLVAEMVIEIPQVYRAGLSKGDPNDLIKVAIGAGRWIERATLARVGVHRVLPNEWKGQIPKDVHHRRVEAELGPIEGALLPRMAASQRHNMMDAVALGLWRLGRLRR